MDRTPEVKILVLWFSCLFLTREDFIFFPTCFCVWRAVSATASLIATPPNSSCECEQTLPYSRWSTVAAVCFEVSIGEMHGGMCNLGAILDYHANVTDLIT